jgi:hypothetical protein
MGGDTQGKWGPKMLKEGTKWGPSFQECLPRTGLTHHKDPDKLITSLNVLRSQDDRSKRYLMSTRGLSHLLLIGRYNGLLSGLFWRPNQGGIS